MKNRRGAVFCWCIVVLCAGCELDSETGLIFKKAQYVNQNTFKIIYSTRDIKNIESCLSSIRISGKDPYTIDELVSNDPVALLSIDYELVMRVRPAFVSGDTVIVKIFDDWTDRFVVP